jgi:SAM-dependent methyltransferase
VTEDTEQARSTVVGRYSQLAREAAAGDQVTDGNGCFGFGAYSGTAGLPEAGLRASLGCGNPVAVTALEPGETVLDMGSGGGIDVLLSARLVGPVGKVYGLDASPEMIGLVRANAAAAGAGNTEFLHGSIEDVPLPDGHVDAGIWTVQSGVFPENTASLRLHERAGFRVVGVRERVGCHHGRWRDTVLVERRSRVAGAG